MLVDNKLIAGIFVSEGGKSKELQKKLSSYKLHDVHYSPVLVTSLMKRAGNLACTVDIIQTIENIQK
jgi:hypothetical protein